MDPSGGGIDRAAGIAPKLTYTTYVMYTHITYTREQQNTKEVTTIMNTNT